MKKSVIKLMKAAIRYLEPSISASGEVQGEPAAAVPAGPPAPEKAYDWESLVLADLRANSQAWQISMTERAGGGGYGAEYVPAVRLVRRGSRALGLDLTGAIVLQADGRVRRANLSVMKPRASITGVTLSHPTSVAIADLVVEIYNARKQADEAEALKRLGEYVQTTFK